MWKIELNQWYEKLRIWQKKKKSIWMNSVNEIFVVLWLTLNVSWETKSGETTKLYLLYMNDQHSWIHPKQSFVTGVKLL